MSRKQWKQCSQHTPIHSSTWPTQLSGINRPTDGLVSHQLGDSQCEGCCLAVTPSCPFHRVLSLPCSEMHSWHKLHILHAGPYHAVSVTRPAVALWSTCRTCVRSMLQRNSWTTRKAIIITWDIFKQTCLKLKATFERSVTPPHNSINNMKLVPAARLHNLA